MCCKVVFELISIPYTPWSLKLHSCDGGSGATQIVRMSSLLVVQRYLWVMLRTQTFSCSSVSKTLQIHPPNDHCSELNAFLFLSLPLVISHFSSLVILTMDYVVHNLSLYLHVSRMTFLFVRGRKSPKSLKTWVSLILSNKWQLISIIEFFFPT